MVDRAAAFVGTIPATYHTYLGPVLFHAYADDLAERLPMRDGLRVLELACGTGIVTERLIVRIGDRGSLVATDLNDAMIANARQRIGQRANVDWQAADGCQLPFANDSFDVVVCQFGLMFFPDAVAGIREALRVLRPGGTLLFNVWDAIEANPGQAIAAETVASYFGGPSSFFSVPFSLHKAEPVLAWLAGAGFVDIACVTLSKTGSSPSAMEAAIGQIRGSPLADEIMRRVPGKLDEIVADVARKYAARFGDDPVRFPLRAHVFSAVVPAR